MLLGLMFLVTINVSAQFTARDKTMEGIIGSWKFVPLVIREDGIKGEMSEWSVMKMTFSADKKFRFELHDAIIQTGTWDISPDGKKILLTNRNQIPEFEEKLIDLSFDVKVNKGKHIKVVFKESGLNGGPITVKYKFTD